MSSFTLKITNPKTGNNQVALCVDNFYGQRKYGYGFRKDGKNADFADTKYDEYDFYTSAELLNNKGRENN